MGFGQDPSITVFISFVIFVFLAAGVTLVLWIAMPFSLFGVKGLMRGIMEEQQKTNRLLEEVRDSLERTRRRAGDVTGGDERGGGPGI